MDYTTIQNAATKIVDNIKVIDGSINALQNKQDIISTSDMSMANSHEGKLKIEEIGGKCEQFTTTGVQLFNCKELAYQDHIAEQDNGFFTFSNSTSFNEFPSHIYELPTGNYVVTVEVESNNNSTFYVTSTVSDYSKPITGVGKHIITFTDVDLVWICIAGKDGASVKMRIMLNAGDTSLPYEPYTGGIPAPNPDYPQAIKKVVVSEIKTHGKNLVNNTAVSQTIGGLTFTVNSDGSVIVNGKSPDDANVIFGLDNTIGERLTIGDTYILSGCPSGGSKDTYRLDCVRQGVTAYMVDSGERSRYTVTENTISPRIRIWIGKGVIINNLTFYPMLRKADSGDNTYEPYTESIIKLSEPIELYGIGDVKDMIEDGKVVRRFGNSVLDGSEDELWRYETTSKRMCYDLLTNKIKRPVDNNTKIKLLCSHFYNKTANETYIGNIGLSVQSSNGRIYVYLGDNVTLEEWIVHLASSPITVLYELAEPVTEPLPLIDQAALNSLSTYDTVTYLDFDSEIEPTFKAEYGVTEIGGRVLEDLMTGLNSEILAQSDADRITALESTIVNNI